MFRIRVLAAQEEIDLIEKAARKERLSVPQFVARVTKSLARELKTSKIDRRSTPPSKHKKSPRRKPKSF